MFKWIKNKWFYFSNLGVNEEMTISLQKKVILSNQIAIIFFISFTFMNFFQIITGRFEWEILYSFASICLLLIVPLLNLYSKYHISAFLISMLTPFFTFIFSTTITETPEIYVYFLPRIFLVTFVMVPFIVIDKSKKGLLIIAVLFTISLIFLFDPFMKLRGYEFNPDLIDFSNYKLFNILIIVPVIIVASGLIFLNNINVKYEKKIFQLVDELKQTNTELEQQKETIQDAFRIIENKNTKITDSIEYAKKIQEAFLPDIKTIQKIIPNSFILYKPRDIVSGDFYWISEIENKKIVIAADCTGHGVPGAFLSVLGITLLNEIIITRNILKPNEILNILRKQVKVSLGVQNDSTQQDGMDIAVAVIDIRENQLEYAGAYNSVYIIRKDELIELKANRQPVGNYIAEKEFETKTISLFKNDIIYMFSDGFSSQFGGENNEKLSTKRFKKLLLEGSKLEISEQKIHLADFLNNWMTESEKIEQIDDILVIGIMCIQ